MKAKGKLLKTLVKESVSKKKGTPKLIKTLKVPRSASDVSDTLKLIKSLAKKPK